MKETASNSTASGSAGDDGYSRAVALNAEYMKDSSYRGHTSLPHISIPTALQAQNMFGNAEYSYNNGFLGPAFNGIGTFGIPVAGSIGLMNMGVASTTDMTGMLPANHTAGNLSNTYQANIYDAYRRAGYAQFEEYQKNK